LWGPLQDEVTRDFYLFLIENRRPELPKDYAKNKTQLLKDFETQRDNEVWAQRREEIRNRTQAEIYDPALVAYRIQNQDAPAAPAEQQNTLREEALQKYQEALQGAGSTESAAIHYQMAQLYQAMNQPAKRVEALQAAVRESSDATQVRLELARALREQKKPQEALTQLNEASKSLAAQPDSPSMFGGGSPAAGMRMQLAMEYDALGRKDLANQQRQLAIPPQGAPGAGGPGMGGPGMGGMPPV
jgi:predicted Zn-dependent protease